MNTRIFQPRHVFLRITSLLLALTMALTATGPAFALAPANDDFDSAVNIPSAPAQIIMDQTTFVDSTQNIDDPNLPVCTIGSPAYNNPGEDTIWYTYTSPISGFVDVNTFGSSFDTIIAVWTGTRTNLTTIICNDDSPLNLQSQVQFNATQGVTYYIEVIQFTSGSAPEKELGPEHEPYALSDYMTLNISLPGYATPGKYDNKDAIFVYPSGWTLSNQAKAYLGSVHQTSGTNPLTVKFYGNQLRLTFTKNFNYGNLSVTIDGGTPATVVQKKSTAAYQQTWLSPLLSEDYHTAQFTRASSTVNVDAVEFFATQDSTLPASITNLVSVSGATDGTVNLFWTAPGDDGSAGIAKSYDVRYSSTAPITLANFATAKKPTGIPVPHLPGTAESMTVSGLAPGVTYYFAVRALDDNYSISPSLVVTGPNTGALSNVPSAIAYYSGIVALPNVIPYQNTAPEWTYIGGWTTISTYNISSVAGNSAIFVFSGTRFELQYCTSSTHGKLAVYVDDVLKTTINQSNLVSKCGVKYLSAVFPAGQHSIKLVVLLNNKKTTIDAITIFP